MKVLLLIALLTCSGCLVRVSIQDNCDTVTGVSPEKVPDVVNNMKEPQEENLLGPAPTNVKEEVAQQ